MDKETARARRLHELKEDFQFSVISCMNKGEELIAKGYKEYAAEWYKKAAMYCFSLRECIPEDEKQMNAKALVCILISLIKSENFYGNFDHYYEEYYNCPYLQNRGLPENLSFMPNELFPCEYGNDKEKFEAWLEEKRQEFKDNKKDTLIPKHDANRSVAACFF